MGKENDSKYARSARTMMLFVAVYIFQWWSYVVYATWLLAEEPHLFIMVCAVTFSNMGGLFNLITYILMRRQKQNNKVAQSEPKSTFKGGGAKTLETTAEGGVKDKSKLIDNKMASDPSSASA